MRFGEALKLSLISLNRNGLPGIKNIILAYINLSLEPLKVSSKPMLIQIEPTLYCNLKCKMCINPVDKRDRRHMQFNEFKKIIDSLPLTRKISLVGAGEPLLNPRLFDMVSYAKSKGILIGFATNGILLDEAVSMKIIDSRIDWLNISIDTSDKKLYEEIRQGADFNLILKNVKRFMEIKGKARLPKVSIWFVIMRENLAELIGVIRLAKELRINKVSAQLQHFWASEQIKSDMSRINNNNFYRDIVIALRNARRVARQLRIEFDYVNLPDNTAKRNCKWPWKACYITADGFVTPCCLHGANPQVINFGNFFKNDLDAIWNNSAYQSFRKALKSISPPDICLGCTAYFERLKV